MAAGPVGTCWKQTPAWGLTTWTLGAWATAVIPPQSAVHTPAGGGQIRGAGVPRKRRRPADPAFSLRKAPAATVVEPPAPVVASTTVAEPEVAEAPRPLVLPDIPKGALRRSVQVPRAQQAVDTRLQEAEGQAKAREAAQEQDDEEAIVAFLMSL